MLLNRHCLIVWLAFMVGARPVSAANAPPPDPTHDYLVHVWQTEAGLPQNWVSSIAQTTDGYLWVGTRYGGLARFDGVRFVTFNQQNTTGLKDVQVEHLSVDRTGRLWIIMGNESVTTFYGGAFETLREPRSTPRLRLDHVINVRSNSVLFASEAPYLARRGLAPESNWQMLETRPIEPDPKTYSLDRNNNIWFITRGKRLGQFIDNHFSLFTNGLPERSVTSLAMDANRQPWITTPHHLMAWDGNAFNDRTPTNSDPPNNTLQMSFSGDGGLWVLEKNRLRKYKDGQWTAEIDSADLLGNLTAGTVSLNGDAQGNAWLVLTGRGLLHCKADGSTYLFTETNGLPSRFITCWFQDAEGDIWIGMHGGGIARIRARLFHELSEADGLPDKVISSISVDPAGSLWVGTMSGELAHWENGTFTNIPLASPPNDPNECTTVLPAKGGGVWIGTLNHGLGLYRDGRFTMMPTPWPTVRVMFADSHDRLWVGGLVNLVCLSEGHYKIYGAAEGFVDSHAIGAMAESADGAVWIGTGPGELWKYLDGRFSRFAPPSNWPAVRFSSVLPDSNGVVWIGTLGGGLLRFCDGQFTRCQKTDGLPGNNVTQLLDSHDGYLWGGTYAGIFRVKKDDVVAVTSNKAAQVSCRVFGQFDGLPSLECSSGFQPACWRTDDGRLWFATANGVTWVDPLKIVPNRIPPTVIIEEMLVDGRSVEVPPHRGIPFHATNSAPSVIIPPGRHYVQFSFTGLSFAAPDGVRFRVRLVGGDGTWQSTDGLREIGYGPLLPGDYRFQVTAENSDGVWNDEGDTLAFTVTPYYWETWWFRAGLGLVTLAFFVIAAVLIQRQRYRRRLEIAERQREIEHERSRIARDLHDDLGTSLTQIGLLSALANRAHTPIVEARELIQQVRGRAREMVVALDEIVWAVNPKNDSLAGLVGYLGHFAEEFFRPTKIRFRWDIPAELPAIALSADARHHLFLAFKEAVNNAARHAHATQVCIRVEILPAGLVIEVEDNGCGFTAQPELAFQAGNGLPNMKRRMKEIHGTAEIKSTPGIGTTVTLRVDLSKL